MSFACLFLPCFRLQVHVRKAPKLHGTSFAIVEEMEGKVPRVTACSRLARDEGVCPGMTATQARAASAAVQVIDGDPAAYRETMQALGEGLLTLSLTVDIETLGVAHVLEPPKRSTSPFGERILHVAKQIGLHGRVGIADDRFTAWVATQALPRMPVRLVPRGGSARFLAPLGLDLLPLPRDMHQALTLLGVRTIGDFAALPPPSVGKRWGQEGASVHALARGEDPTPLTAFMPQEPIIERLDLEAEITELEPLVFVLRPLLERIIIRLKGRGRAAARIELTLHGEKQELTPLSIFPARPTSSAKVLLDLARVQLAERKLDHRVTAIQAQVSEEGNIVTGEQDLFDRTAPSPAAVDEAIAKLRALLGENAALGTKLCDRHRPEGAFERVPFVPPSKRQARRAPPIIIGGQQARRAPPIIIGGQQARRARPENPWSPGLGVLRLLDSPMALGLESQQPPSLGATIKVAGVYREIVLAKGPTRLEGEWWTCAPLARDYYEVETDDGSRFWLYLDHADGHIYLHGWFD
ncbi:MAG: DNA polymerase Y family protein [Deltaproteobacteria bacterium]|nr:DNA polymerase Y family protein [Deltaproteobacteria bacterium]